MNFITSYHVSVPVIRSEAPEYGVQLSAIAFINFLRRVFIFFFLIIIKFSFYHILFINDA